MKDVSGVIGSRLAIRDNARITTTNCFWMVHEAVFIRVRRSMGLVRGLEHYAD